MENLKFKNSMLFLLLLTFATLCIAIGYGAINSRTINVNGTATASPANAIYISNAVCSYDANGEEENSICTYSDLVLTNNISLKNDLNSYIQYLVTVTNTTSDSYAYKGVKTAEGFYSNSDIVYEVSGISQGDEVGANSTITLSIKFKYSSSLSSITNSTLSSMLSLQFAKSYSVTYNGVSGSFPTKAYANEDLVVNIGDEYVSMDIKINNTTFSNYTYSSGVLTIPGANINGDIVITPVVDSGSVSVSVSPMSIDLTSATSQKVTLQVSNSYTKSKTFTLSLSNSNFELVNASNGALGTYNISGKTTSTYDVYIKIKSGVEFYTNNTQTAYITLSSNDGKSNNTSNITITVPLADTTPPTINAISTTLNTSSGDFTVNWSGQDNKGGTIEYTIKVYNSSGTLVNTYTYSSDSTSTLSYTLSGLSTVTSYYVKIYGKDQYGNSGESYLNSATTSSTYCRKSNNFCKYSITYNLSNVTSSNKDAYILAGNTYSTTLSKSSSNYSYDSDNNIKMGGTTLTSGTNFTFNTDSGALSIPNVSGNIEINFSATYGSCLPKGTKITLADGTYKNVEDIRYDDLLLVYNHEIGGFTYEYPIWIEKKAISTQYTVITFEDGSSVRFVGEHSVFSEDFNKYVNVLEKSEFFVGAKIKKVRKINGEYELYTAIVKNIETVYETIEYYDVISTRFYNVIADDVLASDGRPQLSNFFKFTENAIWSSDRISEVLNNNTRYTREELSFMPLYMYEGLRAYDGGVVVRYGYMSSEEFFYIVKGMLLNDNMRLYPMTNMNQERVWMVTTSDDIVSSNSVNGESKENYLHVEGEKYILPEPKISENFICWYNTSDGKMYNPSDEIIICHGMHFVAIYE